MRQSRLRLARGSRIVRAREIGHDLSKALIDAFARGMDAVVMLGQEEKSELPGIHLGPHKPCADVSVDVAMQDCRSTR